MRHHGSAGQIRANRYHRAERGVGAKQRHRDWRRSAARSLILVQETRLQPKGEGRARVNCGPCQLKNPKPRGGWPKDWSCARAAARPPGEGLTEEGVRSWARRSATCRWSKARTAPRSSSAAWTGSPRREDVAGADQDRGSREESVWGWDRCWETQRRFGCLGARKCTRTAWSRTVYASSAFLRTGMAAFSDAGGKMSGWTRSAWRSGSLKVWSFNAPSMYLRTRTFSWIALVNERAHACTRWSKVRETVPWMPRRRSGKGSNRTPSCFTVNTVLSATCAKSWASWSGSSIVQ